MPRKKRDIRRDSAEAVSAALESSLGKVKSKERTAEYYQEATTDETVTAGSSKG